MYVWQRGGAEESQICGVQEVTNRSESLAYADVIFTLPLPEPKRREHMTNSGKAA